LDVVHPEPTFEIVSAAATTPGNVLPALARLLRTLVVATQGDEDRDAAPVDAPAA
jgi:hypothetical protein